MPDRAIDFCIGMHHCMHTPFFRSFVKMVYSQGLWVTLSISCVGLAHLLKSAGSYLSNFTQDLKSSTMKRSSRHPANYEIQ